MSEDEKNLYKIVDKLEQRITTQEHSHTFLESRVDGLDKDIDAITKVLTKMKSDLYYTQKEDQDLKDEIEKAEIKRDQDAKTARDNAEAIKINNAGTQQLLILQGVTVCDRGRCATTMCGTNPDIF